MSPPPLSLVTWYWSGRHLLCYRVFKYGSSIIMSRCLTVRLQHLLYRDVLAVLSTYYTGRITLSTLPVVSALAHSSPYIEDRPILTGGQLVSKIQEGGGVGEGWFGEWQMHQGMTLIKTLNIEKSMVIMMGPNISKHKSSIEGRIIGGLSGSTSSSGVSTSMSPSPYNLRWLILK